MKKINKKLGGFIVLVGVIFIPIAVLLGILWQENIANAADNTSFCTITSAVWSPTKIDNYKDDGTDVADIIVKTKNCAGAIGVNFSVWGLAGCVSTGFNCALPSITNKPLNIPNDNFTLHIALGEEKCQIGNDPDCILAFQFNQGNQEIYYSKDKASGLLTYDCEGGFCQGRNAKFLSLADQGSDDKPVEVAAGAVLDSSSVYNLLAPIPGITCMDSSGKNPLCIDNNIGNYLNIIFKLAIGVSAALAVIMLIINGITYMGDESIFKKTEAKSKMFSAIFGLLIALGAWALLNTINPALTGAGGLKISTVTAEIAGDTDVPTVFNKNTLPSGIVCTGGKANIPNIVQSFSGKMTYEMGAKGVAGPNSTIKLDCSGFVNYVLDCADSNFISGGTSSIFSNAEKVTSISNSKINNIELKVGDLVGWKAGENGEKFGHVMIYIGNGQVYVADSHGPGGAVGKALGTFSISKYQSRIKYIKRIP